MWFGGALIRQPREQKNDLFALQYAKHASIALLTRLYEDPESPRLARKSQIWEDFKSRPVTTRPYHRPNPESVPEEGFEPSRAFQPNGF
jgi:hypothetical protein